ncbi:MAG: acyl-CoA mutase large subunit family protein [Proteobacteria bacterium]|nr:acyl-CoA mutase large subunit family protein [Pseudomonadota bacterium]
MSHKTRSGIELKTVYTPQDTEGFDYASQLNDPGHFPFTRGRTSGGKGSWVQRGLSGEGDSSRSNKQLKYLIQHGQTGVDIIGDAPTMLSMDPDHPFAIPNVGTQGVSVCCLNDNLQLFKGIPLETISISNSNPNVFALAGLYLVAKKTGVDLGRVRGSLIQSPFFFEDCGYTMHLPFPLRYRLSLDSIEFSLNNLPKFHSFMEDAYFFSETGLTSDEEIAFGLVEVRYVLRGLLKRGLAIDDIARQIVVLVNCGMDFFEEIAKIRATRRIFARMMRDEFGATKARSQSLTMTCHTSGISLTPQQPFNNIVRGTIQSMALVMAGIQAIEISAFDEAFRTPSPESHLVALRTQQVIDLETGIGRVHDPFGGSYMVERLTDQVEEKIMDRIRQIEGMGDPADLSTSGWFKKYFENSMDRYHQDMDTMNRVKVGTNVLQMPAHEDTMLRDVSYEKIQPYTWQIEQIREYKRQRDQRLIRDVLIEVKQTASETQDNLMPCIIKAFEAGATCGEITGMLRLAYGRPYDPYGMVTPPFSEA